MRWNVDHSPAPTMDGICEPDDMVDVRIQKDPTGGMKLYLDVNGITVARICRIQNEVEVEVEVTREEGT